MTKMFDLEMDLPKALVEIYFPDWDRLEALKYVKVCITAGEGYYDMYMIDKRTGKVLWDGEAYSKEELLEFMVEMLGMALIEREKELNIAYSGYPD